MTVCLSPNGGTLHQGDAPPRELLVATLDGVTVLQRETPNADWRSARRTLEGKHISALLVEPRSGAIFAGVHGSGLYRSTDGGHTWEPKTRGLTQEHTYVLSAVPRNGDVDLFVGTEPAHLFRSRDGGESWQELPTLRNAGDPDKWMFPAPPNLGHVKTLAFDPRDKGTFFVGIEQGALLKTTDDGETWQELASYSRPDDAVYKDIHRLVLDPRQPDVLYMTTGVGFYRSDDGGETWERRTDRSTRIAYPDALLVSPRDPNLLFMAGSNQSPGEWRTSHDASAAIMRSRDGGRTWEVLTNGLPSHIRGNIEAMSIYAWPGGYALFTGDTDGAIYASDDEGDTWTCIANDLSPVSKVNHYAALR
jgi:photosystem II stability/assembly factor-like uncharacterized protein